MLRFLCFCICIALAYSRPLLEVDFNGVVRQLGDDETIPNNTSDEEPANIYNDWGEDDEDIGESDYGDGGISQALIGDIIESAMRRHMKADVNNGDGEQSNWDDDDEDEEDEFDDNYDVYDDWDEDDDDEDEKINGE